MQVLGAGGALGGPARPGVNFGGKKTNYGTRHVETLSRNIAKKTLPSWLGIKLTLRALNLALMPFLSKR